MPTDCTRVLFVDECGAGTREIARCISLTWIAAMDRRLISVHQSDLDCGDGSSPHLGTQPQLMSIFLVPCRFSPKCAISASSGTQFLFWRFSIVDCSRPLPTLDLKLGAIDAQGQKRNFASTLDPWLRPSFVFYSFVPIFP